MSSLWNKKNIDTIAIKDLSLLSYVLIWVLTLVILPIIPMSMAQFNIINIGYIEALFLLYLNLLFFSLGSSTSRIINYLIKLKKKKELKRKEFELLEREKNLKIHENNIFRNVDYETDNNSLLQQTRKNER
jgi:CBS domain containing-hemolysin-like protein